MHELSRVLNRVTNIYSRHLTTGYDISIQLYIILTQPNSKKSMRKYKST